MTDFVATEPTWVVLTERAELLTVDVGQRFSTGQVCDVFTVEADAVAAAVAVGWTDPEAE
jgi:hypothetical protein